MAKFFLMLGGLMGVLSVAIGAFGAHALKSILEANQRVDTFELASRYHFYHTGALLVLGILLKMYPSRWFIWSGYSFFIGILIFSGSLYLLSLTGKTWLGAITPLGGLALIAAWVFMMLGISSMSN